jgi:hypothetical protein
MGKFNCTDADEHTGEDCSLTPGQVFLNGTRVNVITERSKFLPAN